MERLFAAIFVSGAFALHATDGVLQATSAEAVFSYNSVEESPFGLAAADSFAPVTWQTLETVTVTAPDGTTTVVADNASDRGSYTFTPTVGGVWTLSNSMSGTVKVCVPWSINGDSTNVTSAATAYVVDLEQEGPNRKTHRHDTLPLVAYSGDDWVGDLAKAATVTIAPPSGSGLETTTWSDLAAGNGARSFAFNVAGRWTVTLTFADSTTRSAIINVRNSGFIISVR